MVSIDQISWMETPIVDLHIEDTFKESELGREQTRPVLGV